MLIQVHFYMKQYNNLNFTQTTIVEGVIIFESIFRLRIFINFSYKWHLIKYVLLEFLSHVNIEMLYMDSIRALIR